MAPVGNARAHGFGALAADYHRLRPGPPVDAVEWLVDASGGKALELGAGTGHFTAQLSGRMNDVFVIEPDHRMRLVLTDYCPGIQILDGRAEQIPLPDDSVDAVYAMNAWHWFDPATTGAEIARVLRPGGRLGVLWNSPDRSVDWTGELFAPLGDHVPGREPGRFELPESLPFTPPESRRLRWTTTMSPADAVALIGTYSAVLALPETEREVVAKRSRTVLEDRAKRLGTDTVSVPYLTTCWRTTFAG